MNTKIVWVVVVLLIILGGLFLISSREEFAEGPIKIGFIGPLTGDGAVLGEPGRNMVQMAVDEINAAGGVKGHMLEVIYEDGKCSGKDAASAMQKLATVDKVKIAIGGFCSSESIAAVPIAAQHKVVLFSPASSSPDLTNSSRFFFRDYPSDATQGVVLADLSYNQKSWRKVAVIQEQLDYPAGLYKAFSSQFEKLGGRVVKQEFPTTANDFRSLLTKLRSESPDALFIDAQTPASGSRVMKQLSESGWKIPLLISDSISGDPKTVEESKAILEGALAAEFGIDPSNQKFQQMIANFKQKFGSEPPFQSYAQTEYDAVYIVRDGLLAAGYDAEKFAEWSRTIKDWRGASGSVTIGESGDRASGHVPKVIRDGKVELYR